MFDVELEMMVVDGERRWKVVLGGTRTAYIVWKMVDAALIHASVWWNNEVDHVLTKTLKLDLGGGNKGSV